MDTADRIAEFVLDAWLANRAFCADGQAMTARLNRAIAGAFPDADEAEIRAALVRLRAGLRGERPRNSQPSKLAIIEVPSVTKNVTKLGRPPIK
jgi:hypothetical protein